uniref:3-hydroxyacyl-CoA dehydrogenase n=1 Tax=Parastrongyloides trichosuri TaxID=131310 RepID=A0A0N4ZZ10_PARTI
MILSKSFIRSLSTSKINLMKDIKKVTIVGSGLMGSGIAQVSAQANINVTLVDSNEKALEKAKNIISKSIDRIAKKKFSDDEKGKHDFVMNVLNNIQYTTEIKKGAVDTDLIIEAIVENLEVKQNLFKNIEDVMNNETILTTNTSSLCLSQIGKNLKNKKNFGGLHFFNPVPVMKLLEVVRTSETSSETFDTLVNFGKKIGKTTVDCKDTPGFIVNRLLVPYMFEALRLFERGDASKEDIDVAMKLGAGYPMGPFELADYVGLDTLKFIMDGWVRDYKNEPSFKNSPTLDKLVAENKLGRKTGEGFYKY